MPNLNLTHSGNMNITSASINANGELDVQYGPNNTGAITGWTVTPELDEVVSGSTYDITFYPNMSGTVLTETFTVSGVDEAGVQRSDTGVLRQGYDGDYRNYLGGFVQLTADTPRNIPMQTFRIDATNPPPIRYYFITFSEDPNYPGQYASITKFSICPDENMIMDNNVAKSITGQTLVSGSVYEYTFSVPVYFAGGEENAPYDQVWYAVGSGGLSTDGIEVLSSSSTGNQVSFSFTVTGDTGDQINITIPTVEGSVDCVYTKPIVAAPDTGGTVATSITLNVASAITDSGQASATYSPSSAYVDLHYYTLNPTTAYTGVVEIDEITGEITVLQSGRTWIFVEDSISHLFDAKEIEVYIDTPGPDTGGTVYITSLTLNVASSITDYGVATASYTPSNATVSLSYYVYADDGQFTNPTNLATMNVDTGEITVYGTGSVAVEVYDFLTGLFDRKVINVVKTQPGPDTGDTGGTGEVIVYYNATSTGSSIRILNSTYGVSTYPYAPPFASGVTEYDASVPLSNSTYRFSQIQQDGTPIHYTISDSAATHLWLNADPTIEPYALGAMAFAGVSTIKKVEILGGVKYIGDSCFSGCTSLDTVIIDEGVINMAHLVFADCTSLRNVEMPESMGVDNPTWLSGFIGCTSLTDITLPSGLRTIPDYSFVGCTSLETITMPSGLTQISQSAFAGCTSLREINLNDGITTFNGGCFENCTSLTGVTFPASVTMVGGWAFNGCSGLTKMVFEGTTPPSLGSNPNPLGDPSYRFLIYVPCESVTAYRTAMPDYATRITCEDAPEEEYATSVSLTVNGLVMDSSVVTMTPTPAYASVAPIYQSLNPDVVTVDPFTGELTVVSNGTATITGRDVLTNLSSEVDITCIKTIDPTPYYSQYLTFEILTGGTITWNTAQTIRVRRNGGNWYNMQASLAVSAGDVLEFSTTSSIDRFNGVFFGSSGGCRFNASGNIMSVGRASFASNRGVPDRFYFRYFFKGCEGIVDAERLILPATALTYNCYTQMFMNCVNLTKAPYLPATTLRSAGTGTNTAESCYAEMFKGCSSLCYVKCLAERTSFTNQTTGWLTGVAENGVYLKPRVANTANFGVPSTWTVINVD